MTTIESEKVEVNSSAEIIFTFLCNINNFEKLMPDRVANWQSTEDECSYTIKGMARLGMRIVEKIPNTEIKIVSHGKSPFSFDLSCVIEDKGGNMCATQLIFEADLNPMMKMMVVPLLKNFFDFQAKKLRKLYS